MALPQQSVDLSFAQGIDTKTNPLLVEAPFLARLENCDFTQGGLPTKRNGFAKLSAKLSALADGQTLPTANGGKLATFNDELLAITSNGTLQSWSPNSAAWSVKGSLSPCTFDENPVIRNNSVQSNPSADTCLGITLTAWEDSRGGIRYAIVDETTRTVLVPDASLTTTGTNPHVVATAAFITVVYAQAGSLIAISFNPLAPKTAGVSATIANNVAAANVRLDVCLNPGDSASLVFAFLSTTTTQVEVGYIAVTSTGPTVGSIGNGYVSPVILAQLVENSVAVFASAKGGIPTIFLVTASSSTGLTTQTLSSKLIASAVNVQDASNLVKNIGICGQGPQTVAGNVGQAVVCYETSKTNTYDHFSNVFTMTATATTATKVLCRSVGLASHPFVAGDGNCYVFLVYEDSLQSSVFLYSAANAKTTPLDGPQPGTLCGTGFPSTAGGLYSATTGRGAVPRVFSPASGDYSLPIMVRDQVDASFLNPTTAVSTAYQFFFVTGIDRLDMAWGNALTNFRSVQLGQNTWFTGGMLTAYDGVSPVEANFALYPNNVTATVGAAGSMAPGTYGFVVVWEWFDQFGQVWRSAPSPAISAVIPGGPSTGSVALTIPTLRCTLKASTTPAGAGYGPIVPRGDVICAVYSTQANGTVLYQRVGNSAGDPITAPVYNDTTADSVAFTRTVADASIAANEPLYTIGGTRANLPMPPATLIASTGNRIFVAGVPTEPNVVYASREWVQGEPVNFSPLLTTPIGQADGPITAITTSDTTVLVFTARSVYQFSGAGPDDTGAANPGFTPVALVESDVGSTSPESAVVGATGVFFKSAKGFYLIDRNLSCSYKGWEAEGFNGLSVTSAVMVTGVNQIRFTTSGTATYPCSTPSKVSIVYDYFFDRWMIHCNVAAVSAVNWTAGGAASIAGGLATSYTYAYLDSTGQVWTETAGNYLDGTAPIVRLLQTAPLHFAGIQGYKRLWRLLFLLQYQSLDKIQVQIAYDNESFPTFNRTIDPADFLNGTAYGTGAYGVGPYGGTTDTVFQFHLLINQQLCQTLQITIADVAPSNSPGSVLAKMTALYGTEKKRPFPAAKSIG